MTRSSWIVAGFLAICVGVGLSQTAGAKEPSSTALPAFPYDSLQADFTAASRVCGPARTELVRRGLISDDPSLSVERPGPVSPHVPRGSDAQRASHEQPTSARPVSMHIREAVPPAHQQHEAVPFAINQAHAECFEGDPFPSAKKCQTCHPGHYREWSVSAHAYAQLSPVFNAMSGRLIEANNGTLGDFCIRCHTPIGMALNEPIVMSNMDRHPAAREGVTCAVCHRINQSWGKVSGRMALVAGDLNAPIYGPTGNQILADVLADPDRYGVMKTEDDPTTRGREVHAEVVPFFALTTPAVCGSCHDVFAPNGFRLEDAFSEFKASPAARQKFQNCQDCHMGLSPGEASGYAFAPAAKVGNVWTPPRKRTNHMMAGPDYSIIHPGLFPHNPKAVREEHAAWADDGEIGLATMREWLQFDYRAGWGTDQFERHLPVGYSFPSAWENQARRFRAADILREQFDLLDEASAARHQVLSAGYKLGDIVLDSAGRDGIRFRVNVYNGTDGHGVPTGFDAERLVFLRVTVWDRHGKLVFVSGDLDPNGDVRDSHSIYVHNGELPLDRQLFSLQTRFLTRNIRGGEREQIVPVPYSLDPLPYTRPETRPFTVLGRPVAARKHKHNIEVNGQRWAKYHVDRSQLSCSGPYRAHVDLIAGMVPINLIHFIETVGFDYDMSAREVADAIVAGHVLVHSASTTFHVDE